MRKEIEVVIKMLESRGLEVKDLGNNDFRVKGEKKEVSFISISTKDKFLNYNLITQRMDRS